MNETDNENFLNQLGATKESYEYFLQLKDSWKDARNARFTLESLIILQQYLSKAITDVYKIYDEKLKEQLNLITNLNL